MTGRAAGREVHVVSLNFAMPNRCRRELQVSFGAADNACEVDRRETESVVHAEYASTAHHGV